MKVAKTSPTPSKPSIKRITKPTATPSTPTRIEYKGTDDPAFFVHHNKTHRSVAEAFRNADYATAFYREKSDWDDFVQFCDDGKFIFPLLFVFIAAIFYVVKW